MAKIYPDTNRFIDFYQAALDSIDIFDQLNAFKAEIVLTEQTINEFRRNRVSTLKWLAKEFHKSITIQSPYTTTVLRALPGHKELTELYSAYKIKGKETLQYLNELIEDETKDPIAQKFLALSDPKRFTKSRSTMARSRWLIEENCSGMPLLRRISTQLAMN